MTLIESIGQVLRSARRARGLTLREASSASGGAFPATSIASYERAERSISLERFCRIATVYDLPPDRLLAEILRLADDRSPTLVARGPLEDLPSHEAAVLRGFIREVGSLRGGSGTEVMALRNGDLTVVAAVAGRRPAEFLDAVGSALVSPRAIAD